jgi:hypothetical protein
VHAALDAERVTDRAEHEAGRQQAERADERQPERRSLAAANVESTRQQGQTHPL